MICKSVLRDAHNTSMSNDSEQHGASIELLPTLEFERVVSLQCRQDAIRTSCQSAAAEDLGRRA